MRYGMGATATALVFLGTSGGVLLLTALFAGRDRRVDERLKNLSTRTTRAVEPTRVTRLAANTLSKIAAPLVPNTEERRTRLQTRLIHAGLYDASAFTYLLSAKMLLMGIPVVIGVFLALFDKVTMFNGVLFGLLASIAGMMAPSFWLDSLKKTRQAALRRALPDALDVIVICLEGGLSLPGAFQRVVGELRLAHPLLASELGIVEREILVGRSTGEALRQFADRCDLEEVRSLASVVVQSERFGASIAKT